MNTETYLNSSPRGCQTCVFRRGLSPGFWMCGRTSYYCTIETSYGRCGPELKHWKPRPPRRSLRRWIYETLLA